MTASRNFMLTVANASHNRCSSSEPPAAPDDAAAARAAMVAEPYVPARLCITGHSTPLQKPL
jgi:hypothetical protein